jgi:hypothetical protein
VVTPVMIWLTVLRMVTRVSMEHVFECNFYRKPSALEFGQDGYSSASLFIYYF